MRQPHKRFERQKADITGVPLEAVPATMPTESTNNVLDERVTRLEAVAPPAKVYPFDQQTQLTITHNLGRRVTASLYDADGAALEGDVRCDTLNTITVQFSQPLTGTLVLQ